MQPTDNYYEKAKNRVKQVKSFYLYLIIYISVNGTLIGINMLTSSSFHWFWFPLMGMSIGLVANYVRAFGVPFANGLLTPEWEDRRILEEMRRLEMLDRAKSRLTDGSRPLSFDDDERAEIERLRREDNRQHP